MDAQAQDISQNTAVNNFLSSMFAPLEKDSVSTGYLLDRAVEVADLTSYDGIIRNTNYSDPAIFRNVLATLNSAKVNSRGSSYDADAITNSLFENNVINLGIVLCKYNHIVSNALIDNLISYQSGIVEDVYVNNIWQNPYGERYAFVFTPSISSTTGVSIRFKLSSSKIFGNVFPDVIEFDPGTGLYSPVNIPFDTTVIYNSTGSKELRMRVTLPDNTVLESHSIITILAPPTQQFPSANPTFSCVIQHDTKDVAATVSYKSSHGSSVVKPFIYVEGFDNSVLGLLSEIKDVIDSLDVSRIEDQIFKDGILDDTINRLIGKTHGAFDFDWFYGQALNSVIKDNYDVFYVDWQNPEADMRDNAELLVKIIKWINNRKGYYAERNVIVGHSMGGLITRYALNYMEGHNETHETDYYVSFDSPQLGVNVPLGIQYAFQDAIKVLYGDNGDDGLLTYNTFDPIFSYLRSIYNSSSAKQMMYYFVNTNGVATDWFHSQWLSDPYNDGFPKGDYGHQIENLSIVNGGNYSTLPQTILNFDVSIGNNPWFRLNWQQKLLNFLTKTNNIELSFEVKRNYGNGMPVSTATATYKKAWSWLTGGASISLFGSGYSPNHNSVSSSLPLDNIRSSSLMKDDYSFDFTDNSDFITFSYYAPLLFVPQYSALATQNYSIDYFENPPTPLSETPFYSYLLNDNMVDHSVYYQITPTYYYWSWINEQVALSLSGPQGIVLTGDTFSVSGVPSGYSSPTWSSSNSCVTVNNGLITVNSLGVTTFSVATNNGCGRYHHKHRKVLAGFPSMNLSAVKQAGSSYVVTATCASLNNNLQEFVDELALQGNLRFIWGYKNSDNSYTWTDTTNTRSFVCTALPNTLTHVCMKQYNAPGRESATISSIDIDRRGDNPFFAEPTVMTLMGLGTWLNYNHLSMTTASSHRYYGVWFNSDYSPQPSPPDNIKIGNETFNLITSFSKSIYGETKTVYCFPFMQSTLIQDAIDDLNAGSGHGATLIPIQIRHGTTVLQSNWFFIENLLPHL